MDQRIPGLHLLLVPLAVAFRPEVHRCFCPMVVAWNVGACALLDSPHLTGLTSRKLSSGNLSPAVAEKLKYRFAEE